MLDDKKATTYNLYLDYNHVTTVDSLIQLGGSEDYVFLNYKNIRRK